MWTKIKTWAIFIRCQNIRVYMCIVQRKSYSEAEADFFLTLQFPVNTESSEDMSVPTRKCWNLPKTFS